MGHVGDVEYGAEEGMFHLTGVDTTDSQDHACIIEEYISVCKRTLVTQSYTHDAAGKMRICVYSFFASFFCTLVIVERREADAGGRALGEVASEGWPCLFHWGLYLHLRF